MVVFVIVAGVEVVLVVLAVVVIVAVATDGLVGQATVTSGQQRPVRSLSEAEILSVTWARVFQDHVTSSSCVMSEITVVFVCQRNRTMEKKTLPEKR